MATEIRKVVKEGYEGFYADATAKLERLEEEVRAKVEELIKDDKARLESIIEMCQEEKEFEVAEVETAVENPEESIGE